MGIKKMFKTKGKKSILDSFMIEKGEREVLKSFGEFDVYAPDDNFYGNLTQIIQDSIKAEDGQKITINNNETFITIFNSLTNIEEVIGEKLDIDSFLEIVKRPTYTFRKMKNYVGLLITGEIADHMKEVSTYINMPKPMLEAFVNGASEAEEKLNEINEYEKYKELDKKFNKEKLNETKEDE